MKLCLFKASLRRHRLELPALLAGKISEFFTKIRLVTCRRGVGLIGPQKGEVGRWVRTPIVTPACVGLAVEVA